MTDYTKTTDFAAKDALNSGDPNKVVVGTEIDDEFNNIATAVATKANIATPTFTGTLTAPIISATTSLTLASGATVTAILDDDTMATASATTLATSESVKAYVDTQLATQDALSEVLATGNTTGANNIIVTAGQSITTDTINETTAAAGVTIDSVLLKDGGITATGGGSLTGTWTDLGSVTTVDINGGTVDGVTIGGASAGAGTFTTLNATGGGALTGTWTDLGAVTTVDINGGTIDGATIGGTTPAAGSFTTLNATGDIYSGTGSANFVFGDGLEVERAATATMRVQRTGATASSGEFRAQNGAVVVDSTGGTTLELQVSNTAGLTIDSSQDVSIPNGNLTVTGNQTITSSATTGNALAVTANSLTNGIGIRADSSSATGGYLGYFAATGASFTGRAISALVDHTSATGYGVYVQNDGTGNGVFIDQNGNGTALNVAADNTTSDVVQIVADTATTGRGLYVYSNSGSFTNTNGFFNVVLDNASASGNAARFKNDGTGNSVYIDHNNAAGYGLYINGEQTTSYLQYIQADSLTTGSGLYVKADNATFSGNAGYFYSQNVSSTGTGLRVRQDGTGNAVFIDQNGNGIGLYIDSEATSADVITVNYDAGTTGAALYGYSNSASYSGAGLVRAVLDNVSATGVALLVTNDGTGNGIFIDSNNAAAKALYIDAETTTQIVSYIEADALTSGTGHYVYSNSSGFTSSSYGGLIYGRVANASASGRVAYFRNDGTGETVRLDTNLNSTSLYIDSEASSADAIAIDVATNDVGFFNFVATADADATSAISTLTTSGATTGHIQVSINGTKAWIAVSTNNPS